MNAKVSLSDKQVIELLTDLADRADQQQMERIVGIVFGNYDFHQIEPLSLLRHAASLVSTRHHVKISVTTK